MQEQTILTTDTAYMKQTRLCPHQKTPHTSPSPPTCEAPITRILQQIQYYSTIFSVSLSAAGDLVVRAMVSGAGVASSILKAHKGAIATNYNFQSCQPGKQAITSHAPLILNSNLFPNLILP